MLTSLFYYDHYRPYTIKEHGNDKLKQKIKAHDVSSKSHGKNFLLNKACKNDVVSFARNISQSITGLRESSKKLDHNISKLQQFSWYRSLDNERHWIKEDFMDFIDNFNEAYKCSFEQDHNVQLSKFAANIKQCAQEIRNNKIQSNNSFFRLDDENNLIFDERKFDELDYELILETCSDFKKIAVDIKDETEALLLNPLTAFMNFKNLASYYNYKFGSIKDNTYKIIENGMLFDLII